MAWLHTILHNTFLNMRWHAGRSPVTVDSEIVEGSPGDTARVETPEQILMRDTLNVDLQRAVDSLPDVFRQAVWLRDEVVQGFDHELAELLLADELGIDATVPAESADFDVLDVRQCLYDEGAMAHVLYEWRGQPVSLFVVPGRSDRDQIFENVGHDAVIWSQGDYAYVLVAEQGPVEIGQVAEYVREYTD